MVYIRGNAADFDDWTASGNPGWSYRELLRPWTENCTDFAHGISGTGH